MNDLHATNLINTHTLWTIPDHRLPGKASSKGLIVIRKMVECHARQYFPWSGKPVITTIISSLHHTLRQSVRMFCNKHCGGACSSFKVRARRMGRYLDDAQTGRAVGKVCNLTWKLVIVLLRQAGNWDYKVRRSSSFLVDIWNMHWGKGILTKKLY